MYTEINRQMEEAQQGIYRLRKIDSVLQELRNEKQSLEQKVRQLKAALDKENYDVEKLEKRSLSKFFYSVLGNFQQRLEKEQSEALAAKLKYDEAAHDLEEINHKISALVSERAKYRDCEYKYRRLYDKKKEMLMESDSAIAQNLLDLDQQLKARDNELREIREAISAGVSAINMLNSALEELGKAKSFGTWDMLGGGLLTDLAKHSHIDGAKSKLEQAQTLLRRFKAELSDVNIHSDILIETGGFAKFADFFFDGLFADWNMQSKIRSSLENVTRVRNQVQGILSKLKRGESLVSSDIKKLEKEIDSLIINT